MRKIIIALVALFFGGCCTTSNIKRFREAISVPAEKVYVSVSLFATKSEDPTPSKQDGSKTLWDLKDRAQAKLIDLLSNPKLDKDNLTGGLNNTYLKDDEPEVKDFSDKHIKIILSVSKLRDYLNLGKTYTPADRIEYLKMSLRLKPDQNAAFKNWDKFQTEYASISIATVADQKTFSANLSGNVGDTLIGGIQGGVQYGAQHTENQNIQYRYTLLNGQLTDDSLTLEEEGTREIDLNGNIVLDVVIRFKSAPDIFTEFDNLFDSKTGKTSEASEVKFNIQYFNMPDIAEGAPLKADINYDYVYRYVQNGYATFQEYDDEVIYKVGHGATKNISLISPEDIKPKRWTILSGTDNFRIKTLYGKIIDLKFPSYQQALDFKAWMLNYTSKAVDEGKPIVIGKDTLMAGSTALTKTIIDHARESININIIR